MSRLNYYLFQGDAMIDLHHGHSFTTKDSDNDMYPGHNCAYLYMGAWWYSNCHRANLNGQYHEENNTEYGIGINWFYWKGYIYSLKITEMKTRRIHLDLTT